MTTSSIEEDFFRNILDFFGKITDGLCNDCKRCHYQGDGGIPANIEQPRCRQKHEYSEKNLARHF
jgi:hypothetical protein